MIGIDCFIIWLIRKRSNLINIYNDFLFPKFLLGKAPVVGFGIMHNLTKQKFGKDAAYKTVMQ